MITINQIREFVAESVSSIDALKKGRVIVTKDDLNRFVKEHHEDDNFLLLGIVPEHDISGGADAYEMSDDLGFYILAKTNYSEYDYDAYLDIFRDAQTIARDFVDYMFALSLNEENGNCHFLQSLNVNANISISPVKAMAGCNGYYVGLQLENDYK